MKSIVFLVLLTLINSLLSAQPGNIPLPEHPRPDFYRPEWKNLNGTWEFRFDREASGEEEQWQAGRTDFNKTIKVPFSWAAPLSGVEDQADIGWYKREIDIPEEWMGKKVILVIGACDWKTKAWIDGNFLGEHQGGYTPFDFDLTSAIDRAGKHILVIRVDDTDHPFKLEGKQGYGKARGIWQTIYLEVRGNPYFEFIHVSPDIDESRIRIEGQLSEALKSNSTVKFSIENPETKPQNEEFSLDMNKKIFSYTLPVDHMHLWNLDDPFLYDMTVTLQDDHGPVDQVQTYFGMRKISVMNLPGTGIPYVALNNKPVYLQLTLDQAYHPEGFYTFPSDEFVRNEILRIKRIGLNGQRIHVKVGIPRKLYWADKLGLLIMADVPNSWGEPDEKMRKESSYAMVNMIKRDYNHPSIFMWVLFNETWGLFTGTGNGRRQYLKETQQWVADLYKKAHELDPTRLVEDNSACNYDHVMTDINSWHAYLPGYKWKERLDEISAKTFPGSTWNFADGYTQGRQPDINSECGNVWGYQGSTGDVDWSWDYHIMINEFRKHPKIAGWLYTEHHDVINEWNGYYRFDRTTKDTGLSAFGMNLNDLHSPIQITPETELCEDAETGEVKDIPLWLSVFTDNIPGKQAIIKYYLTWIDESGLEHRETGQQLNTSLKPWESGYIDTIRVRLPEDPGLAILHFSIETGAGMVLSRNFTSFRIEGNNQLIPGENMMVSIPPGSFKSSKWSIKQSEVLSGLKVNGFGSGYFEYEFEIPGSVQSEDISSIIFKAELSSREMFGKDVEESDKMSGDYMRGSGTHDPSLNPNSYPMTDEKIYPGMVRIYVNGLAIGEYILPDDPADQRGILSWHAQPHDGKLREAGSYGYLVEAAVPDSMIPGLLKRRILTLRLEVPQALPSGLSVYGKEFGRYPIDPEIFFTGKK